MSIGWSFGSSLGGCGKHDYRVYPRAALWWLWSEWLLRSGHSPALPGCYPSLKGPSKDAELQLQGRRHALNPGAWKAAKSQAPQHTRRIVARVLKGGLYAPCDMPNPRPQDTRPTAEAHARA